MENKEEIFWNRFQKDKDALMDIDSLEDTEADRLMLKVDKYLKEYCEGLDFILGDLTETGRSLTFTAEGDTDYFDDVEALCAAAPPMDFWQIVAFNPPMGKNQQIEESGIKLRSKDLFFMPMESEEIKGKIGMEICGRGLQKNDDTLLAAWLLVEKMIGEWNTAMMIDYFDIVTMDEAYSEKGFLPLNHLPDFIEWKIEKDKK